MGLFKAKGFALYIQKNVLYTRLPRITYSHSGVHSMHAYLSMTNFVNCTAAGAQLQPDAPPGDLKLTNRVRDHCRRYQRREGRA